MRIKLGSGEIRTVSRSYGARLIEQGKGVPAGPEKKAPEKKARVTKQAPPAAPSVPDREE